MISTKIIPQLSNNVSYGRIDYSNNGGKGASLYYERDEVTKTITFYEANATVNNKTELFSDVSTNTYDDLISITIETRFNFNIFGWDSYVTIERVGATTQYQLTPLNITNTVTSIDRIAYVNINGSMLINYVNGETDTTLPVYYLATLGADAVQCTYTQTGCYTARIYVNGNDVPVFNNYEDNVICVNSLANNNPEQTNTGFITGISNQSFGAKILIVFSSILLTFLIVFLPIILLIPGDNTTFAVAITSILVVSELILFTVIGLIPGWILFLLFVLSAGIIAVFGRKTVVGA